MNSTEPCKFCGCAETNLVDGFYYCAECGTQDKNVRETLIDFCQLADGTFGLRNKSRVTEIPKAPEVQMSDDWYKWHTINFLLRGLADEVIAAGAQPSFKTKLLWVWTRYMDKYQNKADFGLAPNEESQEVENTTSNEKQESDDDDDGDDNNDDGDNDDDKLPSLTIWRLRQDIKNICMPLIISMLYVALNLDKSHIQLTHLIFLMKQGKVSVVGWNKLVPKELKPKKLRKCLHFNKKGFIYSHYWVRMQSILLFRDLDLGNPVVPDLRLLLDDYLKELCLPSDIKALVLSLLHIRSFDYLDINVQYRNVKRMPSYELYVMGHILMALKICFGLDSDYEYKLSDVVDKINDQENYSKSYNIYNNPEPTDRLFCFRDWCNYMRFRQTLLWTHTLYLGAPNYFDMNDYVAMEHLVDMPDYVITLKDEITAEILKKIQCEGINVIPRSEFVTTLTPYSTYSRVILDHMQDAHAKMLLGEDFTQYSLKYIIEDMFLVDPDSSHPQNILKGVSRENKVETNRIFFIMPRYIVTSKKKRKVYVKDCDNHNWLITQRPNIEHIINEDKSDNDGNDEKENIHTCLSNLEAIECLQDSTNLILDDNANENSKVTNDTRIGSELDNNNSKDQINDDCNSCVYTESDIGTQNVKFNKIREQIEDVNIFDDDFLDLDVKEEIGHEPVCNDNVDFDGDCIPNYNELANDDFLTQEYNTDDRNSDVSSDDSVLVNADSLNRDEAIKQLLVHACRKYKIYCPGIRGRVSKPFKFPFRKKPVKRDSRVGELKEKIKDLMSSYQTYVENDIFHQMSTMVQSAITNFNETKHEAEAQECEEPPQDAEADIADDLTVVNNDTAEQLNNTNLETEDNETLLNKEYKLFGDSSDGETYAEELLPKKNPNYDENTHDVSQLYLKLDKDLNMPEIELNPKLIKIVDRYMQGKKEKSANLANVVEKSDSEDELPLKLLLEQRQLRKQLSNQNQLTKTGGLKPLIQNTDIRPYNYWIKHYNNKLGKSPGNQFFADEMDNNLPKSFVFVLKQCADVVGYEPHTLHRTLQNIEDFMTSNNIFFRNRKKRPAHDFFMEPTKAKKKRDVH